VDASCSVLRRKEDVDPEYGTIACHEITFMLENPQNIKRVMILPWSARVLERIGDHAKNIGEYVIYIAEGRDVRYTGVVESGIEEFD
jgi:phosphate transport system protein